MMSVQLQKQANAAAAAAASRGDGVAIPAASPTQVTDAITQVAESPALQNRAGDSESPYIQAHQDTPVAWQLLDKDAVALAKSQNKLIFMNIGFKACHYCRLTTQESFRNKNVAALLNSSFIPIIVDREERPDIDSIYMNYIQAVNSAGGWPLNVFLTPELEPVFGGTYWPGPGRSTSSAVEDGEEPLDFLGILKKLQKVWTEQEAKCRKEAQDIVLQLREFAAEGTMGVGSTEKALSGAATGTTVNVSTGVPASTLSAETPTKPATSSPLATDLDVDLDQLEEAYANISRTFDRVSGGFNLSPKFPTPPKLSFLLRLAHLPPEVGDIVGGPEEVEKATHMALATLRALRDGGLRDHIGAGFHRYSVTADWSVPHFEKMIADNALLLGVYLDAWLGQAAKEGRTPTLDDEFADVVLELGDYLGNTGSEIGSSSIRQGSLLATSEASDSYQRKSDKHMREGAFYLWTRREFDATVSSTEEGDLTNGKHDGELYARVAAAYWNVKEHGNIPEEQDPNDEFINQNVLRVVKTPAELNTSFGIAVDEVNQILAQAKKKLRARRDIERVRPDVDEKQVVAYNAMAISALARAGAVLRSTGLDKTRGGTWIKSAEQAARDIKAKLFDQETGKLSRHWFRNQKSSTDALAEDYAFLIEALLDLYEATGDESAHLDWAQQLQDKQIGLFYDHVAAPSGQSIDSEAAKTRSGSGGFYSTVEGAPNVILRLKDGMDTSQPSTNAVSASNLFRLALILNNLESSTNGTKTARQYDYDTLARETIKAFEVEMLQYPFLFTGLLISVVSARLGGQATFADVGQGLGVEDASNIIAREFACKPRGGLRALCIKRKDAVSEGVNVGVSGIIGGVEQLKTGEH
ncbi:uncharacterized protein PpBr36_09486 [Pyricularia pennisetigena]|uniref:uncharacterized protein n=1 Tax=Pyricularia pennisetigena TaxID=1578925 RepID=UPI00114E7C7D|nr:uncharacterized protein PpBr36_09486 [Pyricularia pennisetigena]TLS21644.1 hypothetical protein PpBr36_09486 [Pyricularia pennisetigena]